MDFKYSEEQEILRDTIRDFAQKEIAPVAAELDAEARFPKDIVAKLAELGFMGMMIPSTYGGSELDAVCYVIAVEEISKACASTGVTVSVQNSLVCQPLLDHADEEQKKKFLVPLASGKKLGAFSLTEPDAGSDIANVQATAVLEGDHYVINGTKIFVTSGGDADTIVLFASTDRSKKSKGISTFIVEKDTPGFSPGKKENKMGMRASGTYELVFENARIPKENLLGQEGEGMKISLRALDGGRIGIAAQAVGIAQAALDASIEYSKQRKQFGKVICEFQAIQWMLADMATEIDAARLLTYRVADLKDQGIRYTKEAAMAKLYASEVAMRSAIKAVQIHGGYGYMKEYPVERNFRDAKLTEIYEGTSEIQRLVIAASLLR
ncbi:MAG: acyl-CoA dehydrogenase [Candidatus Eisenbacteria sp.]|nr:acyl-CoA dehydrogenase [Candidatus Eisenbacteria bacterium]